MKEFTIREIRDAVSGKLLAGDGSRVISDVSTDSRLAGENSLFVPIIGEIHDAHKFIPGAVRNGCHSVIVSDPGAAEGFRDLDVILVRNTTKALQSLAAYYLRLMDLRTVAVTGSVGKTSTKDIAFAVLSEKYKTGTTMKNYNNDIGVPLTIFSFNETMEAAVLEIGMSSAGEIHRLANIIRPDVGIITDVGVSHMEFLGSRENIRAAKMEITDYFHEGNALVINHDNDMLKDPSIFGNYEVIRVGTNPGDDYYIHHMEDHGIYGIKYKLRTGGKDYDIDLPLPGAHNAMNAALSVAACGKLGVTPEEAVRGVKKARLTENRLAVTKHNGMTVIDDSYNAAPSSMRSAINTLMKSGGTRKVAILGGMNELGKGSPGYHHEIGLYAGEKQPDLIIAIGDKAEEIARGAREKLPAGRVMYFPTKDEFYREIGEILKKGDTILIKGSRTLEMEKITERIIKEQE